MNLVDRVTKNSPEFCPACGSPVERTQDDDSRLCEICGWWGDISEVLHVPPRSDIYNPILAIAQVLELYRGQCRRELVLEIAYDEGSITEVDLKSAKIAMRQSLHSMIEMFVNMKMQLDEPEPEILETVNGTVSWPEDWTDYHYNASHEPCDMLIGPCSCGAWHSENETWVQEILKKHNAVIA